MEEASRRDFSLKPKEASDTIIASAICRHNSFRGRGSAATIFHKIERTIHETMSQLFDNSSMRMVLCAPRDHKIASPTDDCVLTVPRACRSSPNPLRSRSKFAMFSAEARFTYLIVLCYNLSNKQESTCQHCSNCNCCTGNWLAGLYDFEIGQCNWLS